MMSIEIIEEWGSRLIEFLASDSFVSESDFKIKLKGFNSEQKKATLTWVRAQITWNKSKIWKAGEKDAQILEMINDALCEAENDIITKSKKHKR